MNLRNLRETINEAVWWIEAVWWVDEFKTSVKGHWKSLLFLSTAAILTVWVGIGYLLLESEVVTVTRTETKATDVEIVEKFDKKSGKTISVPKNIDTYFVYTDVGAFVMEENRFYLRLEVADTFGKLVEGKKYRFYHLGVRLPMWDMFENVIYIEPLD